MKHEIHFPKGTTHDMMEMFRAFTFLTNGQMHSSIKHKIRQLERYKAQADQVSTFTTPSTPKLFHSYNLIQKNQVGVSG